MKPETGLVFSGSALISASSSSSSSSSSIAKPSTLPPHLRLLEFKHRLLAALSKLADRDTQKLALDDLHGILQSVSSSTMPVCLACLCDTDAPQKGVVKKERLKLLGELAFRHADLVLPHLSKIMDSVLHHLHDPDTSVRDACVHAVGVLSALLLSSSGLLRRREKGTQAAAIESTLSTIIKPLLDALCEQNKSLQIGASMCLTRLVETVPSISFHRLCPRICKFLSNPNFLGKAALLPVIGNVCQVGVITERQLHMIMPCLNEALQHKDWATRKAAAEILGRLASNLGPSLSDFKSHTHAVLESCRFDKVKPVRESIQDTILLWKQIRSPCADSEIQPEVTFKGPSQRTDNFQISSSISNEPVTTSGADLGGNISTQLSNSTVAKKATVSMAKGRPSLTKSKPNPDFFQKLGTRSSDNWQVEIAIPRHGPLSMASSLDKELSGAAIKEVAKERERVVNGTKESLQKTSVKDEICSVQGGQAVSERTMQAFDNDSSAADSLFNHMTLDGATVSGYNNEMRKSKQMNVNSFLKAALLRDERNPSLVGNNYITSHSNTGKYGEKQPLDETSNWLLIHLQISSLKCQQSNLKHMLQDFMGNCQEAIWGLEKRLRILENVVKDMVLDNMPSYRMYGGFSSGKYYLRNGYSNNKSFNCMNSSAACQMRLVSFGSNPFGLRDESKSMSAHSDCKPQGSDKACANFTSRSSQFYCPNKQRDPSIDRVAAPFSLCRSGREDFETDKLTNKKDSERQSRIYRLNEGPSARSVWQATKDEATLAAIRVAEDGTAEAETHLSGTSSGPLDTDPEKLRYKARSGPKKSFWNVWNCTLNYVLVGDLDSAYKEVICHGNEAFLVKLMNKTGPCIDHLSTSTAARMIYGLAQLLQQPIYFGVILPWIQQVVDLTTSNGAKYLDLPRDVQEELLLSLQEVVFMELPETWQGKTIDQLIENLANGWLIDLVQFRNKQ